MYIMLGVIDGLTILQTEKSLPVKPPHKTPSLTRMEQTEDSLAQV